MLGGDPALYRRATTFKVFELVIILPIAPCVFRRFLLVLWSLACHYFICDKQFAPAVVIQ